ncbi:hypothetical protein LPJ73_003396 [Coemansia sp. RSA 2703]|nr:hypothetical protein LPJ73_003396 [Coemansia sp. RSA 2703]
MDAAYATGIVHLFLSSFVLWIVPAHLVFLADLVAFPASLFFSLRAIVVQLNQKQPQIADAHGYSTASGISEQCADRSDSKTSAREMLSDQKATRRGQHKSDKLSEPLIMQNKPESSSSSNNNRRVPHMRLVMLATQLLLFAMLLDFVYRPLLTPGNDLTVFRPGYVSHDSARLHIRYSEGGKLELRYRVNDINSPWESAGKFNPPTKDTDFTTTSALINLRPSTKYIVELLTHQPTARTESVLLDSVEFKTAPGLHSPTRLRFGTGSCIKPNFPYRPTISPDIYGFESMLEHSSDMDMIMFMGDFIYADVPLYFGASTEDYRRLYRQVYMAKSSRHLMRKVPMLHVYDDHEIKNNWHNQEREPMGSAMTAYNEYNGLANPPPQLPGRSYYNFTHGNVAFYAWDTRRYRTRWEDSSSSVGNGVKGATMLGAEQKRDFIQWLSEVNHTAAVKFVVSSVPLTTGWSNFDSSQDTWRGYPTERSEILELTKYIPNLFFLSGDRHEMAAVELPSGNIEFSTSPISQFTFPLVGKFKRNINGEKTLHYRRPGHVKYGIIDVDTESDPDVPKIKYSLYTTDVDQGRSPAWVYEASGVPWV